MKSLRGMTLIDVVVGTALVVIIFLALFGILRASVLLSTLIKSEATATAIANSQMEYIRSLSYDSVGTVGGIPNGTIPEYATTTEDGVPYGVRTFVQYYDDPADGTSTNDTNGITTDYKNIKVTVTYPANGQYKQITLVSNYAPPGVETTVGGGTLEVTVVNATGNPVPGATVTITNASTSPAVNLTTYTDVNGLVQLPGAATSTQYDIVVTKSGYSSAQTYARAGNNQNPNPGYMTIVQNQTTNQTFAIDVLGTLTLSTYSPIATSTFSDAFADSSKLVNLSDTVAGGGSLTLAANQTSGTALSTTTAPAYLASWGVASSTVSAPSGTSAVFQVVDQTGTPLPNTVLPGNSSGFTGPVNLSAVSTTTYPRLALMATLSGSASSTPYFSGWSLSYTAGPTPLPNVGFTLTGAKTIGSTGGGAPIYKTTVSSTTGSTGSLPMSLEWDSYSLSVPNYDIVDACNVPPYALSPSASLPESLILSSSTPNSLFVTVTDGSGNTVPGATVSVSNTGYSKSFSSSSCGNAYFGSIAASTNYSITISAPGYTTTSVNNVTVSGETFYGMSF